MGLADSRTKVIEKFKSELAICLAIFILALTLRIIYFQELKTNPLFYHPQVDAESYLDMARQIADGEFFRANKFSFYQPPLYPFLLAAVFKVITRDLFFIHLGQLVLGALNCVLVYALGKTCFGKRIAVLAGVLACLYWPFIYFEGELLVPALAIFLILCFLNFFVRYLEQRKVTHLAMAGAALGLAALTTPTVLLFGWAVCPIFIFLWKGNGSFLGWRRNLRSGPLHLFIFLCTSLAMILPVTAFNWRAEKAFVLISHNGGLNFYIGNSPRDVHALDIRPGEKWNSFIRTPQRENPQSRLTSAEFSRYWYAKSWLYIKRQPVEFLMNQGKKALQLLDAYEIKRNMDVYFFQGHFSKLMRLPLLGFGIVVPFAFVGMMSISKASIKVRFLLTFVLVFSLSVILFFVASRYRLPILPVMMLFAASGVVVFVNRFKERRIPWQAILVLLLGFLLVNADPFRLRPNSQQELASEAESWYYVGRAQGEAAQSQTETSERGVGYIEAIATMRRASEIDTSFAYPHTFMGIYRAGIAKDLLQNIGQGEVAKDEEPILVEQARRNFEVAVDDYRTALRKASELLSPLYNLCLALYYLNILDFNYADRGSDTVKAKINQRCNEIERLADDLLQRGTAEDKEKYSDIRFKAVAQKQAVFASVD